MGLIMLRLENKKSYGNVRMHGAISWGMAHIFIGLALDFLFDIEWMFVMYALLTIPFFATSHWTFKSMTHSRPENALHIQMSEDIVASNDKNDLPLKKDNVSSKEFLNYLLSEPSTL